MTDAGSPQRVPRRPRGWSVVVIIVVVAASLLLGSLFVDVPGPGSLHRFSVGRLQGLETAFNDPTQRPNNGCDQHATGAPARIDYLTSRVVVSFLPAPRGQSAINERLAQFLRAHPEYSLDMIDAVETDDANAYMPVLTCAPI